MTLRALHRTLGLVIGAFWCLQALTGALVAFRYDLDDALIPGVDVPLNPAALGTRIAEIERSGGTVESVWSSGSGRDRFDIYVVNSAGEDETLRVNGAGALLRRTTANEQFTRGALLDGLSTFHESVFAGEPGHWVVGISGGVLLINLLSGVWFARPHRRSWRAEFVQWPTGTAATRLHKWHRLLGL